MDLDNVAHSQSSGKTKSLRPGPSEDPAPHFYRSSDTNSQNEATPGNREFAPPHLSPSKRFARKRSCRFPTVRQVRAIDLGADELHARLEWQLRNRPKALRNARRRYASFCYRALTEIERAA